MEKTIRKNIVDTYIAFAVGIQPLLVILQQVLLDVVHMDEVTATALRVALTASTMTPAIIISTFRKPVLFIATYLIVFIALLLNSLVFPTNDVFIKKEAFRFLLPVSIPSCLCLLTIHDFFVFEKTLCKISIVSFLLVIIYVVAFFMGVFFIEDYDMSFGYGCLLPMVILYSKDHKLYKLLSFFLFVVVTLIGSRGAALVFLLFVVLDTLLFNRKQVPLLIVVVIVVVVLFPLLLKVLDNLGIVSRTISLLMEGELISYDSGRSEIYNRLLPLIGYEPLGHGLYGDRVILNGGYCHNFFIELFYDLGIVGGALVSLFLIGWIASIYFKSDKNNKRRVLQFIVVVFIPLLVSGSFLKDYNFGLLLGVLLCIGKDNKRYSQMKVTQIVDLDK